MTTAVFLDFATLTTAGSSSGTSAPSSGTSETWDVSALSSLWPALSAGETVDMVDPAASTEVIQVTSSAGSGATSITVTRGAASTTPVAHGTGATFEAVVAAPALNSLLPLSGGEISGDLSIDGTLKLPSGATITLGPDGDTDLYRAASGKLATDGELDVGSLLVYGTTTLDGPLQGLQDRGSQVFNVRAYGAVGDGSTDDTTAVQAAIDAAHDAGGGNVFFPTGMYNVSSALTIYSLIKFFGTGASVIVQTSSSADGFRGTITTDTMSNVVFENLVITGPSAGSGNGIYLKNSATGDPVPFTYCTFINVKITGFGGYGFNAESLIVSTLINVVTSGCTTGGFFLNGNANSVDGSNYTTVNTSVSFISCYADNSAATYGFHILQSTYCKFVSCAADDADTAYLIDTCNNISWSGGCEWSTGTTASPGDGWKITGSTSVTLDVPYTYQCPGVSVWVTGDSSRVTIIGPEENAPQSAPNSIKVDSGSQATIINPNVSSATDYSGTVTVLDDGSGNLSVPGTITTGAAGTIKFGTAGDADLYRIGANSLATDGSLTVYGNIQGRIAKRVLATAGPGATPTLDTDNYDVLHLTALAADITSMTTNLSGTPVDGDELRISFTDNGTARTISWGSKFESSTVTLPTTTVTSARLDTGFVWDSEASRWRLTSKA